MGGDRGGRERGGENRLVPSFPVVTAITLVAPVTAGRVVVVFLIAAGARLRFGASAHFFFISSSWTAIVPVGVIPGTESLSGVTFNLGRRS